jgi:hypothetical protein
MRRTAHAGAILMIHIVPDMSEHAPARQILQPATYADSLIPFTEK